MKRLRRAAPLLLLLSSHSNEVAAVLRSGGSSLHPEGLSAPAAVARELKTSPQHALRGKAFDPASRASLLQGGAGSADHEKLVRLLSEELLGFRQQADVGELECRVQEENTRRLAADLGAAAQRAQVTIAALEAKVAEHSKALSFVSGEVVEAREALKAKRMECSQQEGELHEERRKAEEELQYAQKLGKTMLDACKKSSLLEICRTRSGRLVVQAPHLATRLQARRRLSSRGAAALLQARSCRTARRAALRGAAMPRGWVRKAAPLRANAQLPEPDLAAANATVAAASQSSCAGVEDTADDLRSAAASEVAEAREKLGKHDAECASLSAPVEADLRQKVLQLSSAQEIVAQAESSKSELRLQIAELSAALQHLIERNASQAEECSQLKARLQEETANVVRARKAAFAQFFASEPQDGFKDCEVGDWSTGPCSKPCADSEGHPGQQVMTRSVVTKPDTSTLPGRLSAACPATEQTVQCNDIPCPVDCEMTEWSEWAGCSRQCGAGEQYRTRTPRRIGLHGGRSCGASTETRACNLQACRSNCELAEWSSWSPCSRRCIWHKDGAAGHSRRMRAVVTEATGGGRCPSEEKRTQFRECNPFACSEKVEELGCTADQDIVFVMDGSASLVATAKGAAAEANFEKEKEFVKSLLAKSTLTGKGSTVEPTLRSGVRAGVVLFGGASRPQVVSPVTGEKDALTGAVGKVAWPKGLSPVGQGLGVAGSVLRAALGRRHATVVLLSDGRMRDTSATYSAARRLRSQGARVVVALVQPSSEASAKRAGKIFCRVASYPCVDNVLRVSGWDELNAQLGRFLSVVCPVAFSAA